MFNVDTITVRREKSRLEDKIRARVSRKPPEFYVRCHIRRISVFRVRVNRTGNTAVSNIKKLFSSPLKPGAFSTRKIYVFQVGPDKLLAEHLRGRLKYFTENTHGVQTAKQRFWSRGDWRKTVKKNCTRA